MTESIQVKYRNIGSIFGILNYYHQYLLYTDSNGNQYAASGWAEGGFDDFGNIITTEAPYDSNVRHHINWNKRGANLREDLAHLVSREVVAESRTSC